MIHSVIETAVHGHMGERKHMDAESFRAALAPFRGVFLTADELKLTDAELQDKDAEALVRLVEDRALDLYGKRPCWLRSIPNPRAAPSFPMRRSAA